tara:strand:+ start:5293 stop:7146 length:1854 start_codon:yes stop_codon:yes gene_type:complete
MVFALTTPKTFSQEAKLDSLMQVYQSQEDDTSKVNTLKKLFDIQLYITPEKAKTLAIETIALSKKIGYEKGETIGHYNLGSYYYIIQKNDSSTFYNEKTIQLADKPFEITLKADAMNSLANIESRKGNYDTAIWMIDSLSSIYLDLKDYFKYGIALGNIATNYRNKGYFALAMDGYMKALKVLDTISKEPFRKADITRDIGKLNLNQGNSNASIKYFEEALRIYEESSDNLYMAYTLMDIGNAYKDIGDYEKAIHHYQKSISISEKNNYPDNTSNGYINLGISYREQGKYQLALFNLLKSLDNYDYDISSLNKIIALYQTGKTYTAIGETEKALSYLNRSITMAENTDAINELKFALEFRVEAYENSGQLGLALQDQKRYQTIKDSLFTIEKTKKIEELRTIYETEKKEAALALQKEEINTLNEKAKVDKLTKGLYAGGMVSFFTISGLLFFGFRQRMKKNRIEREKQEEIYKQEIEHKKKELASQTLHLVQKNTFLQELKENLDKIKRSPELFKVEFRRLTMLLKKQTAEDKDWEVFKSYFADVHDNFDNKLRALHEGITDKEIRLAAFLRMNLTTKEIAAMFNVIPTSILTSKYRLKKKLGLNKETDLTEFLNTL